MRTPSRPRASSRALQVLGTLAALSASTCPALLAQDAPAAAQGTAPAAAQGTGETIELDAKVPSLLVLDEESKVWSLQVTSKSRLDVKAGDVVINSTHDSALWNADGTIEAAGAIRVSGGVKHLGRPSTRPAPETSAAPATDPVPPFLVAPVPLMTEQKLFLNNEPEVTLRPGIYTDGIFATGAGSVITMRPGTYIINGGDFFVSGARLQGQGVTIVMSGAQPGRFWPAQGAQIDLSAPEEGPLRNIVLVSRAQGWNMIQSDGAKGTIKGLVYAPQAGVGLSAGSDLTLDRLICLNLSLALSSKLQITGRDLTLTKLPPAPAPAPAPVGPDAGG